MLPHARIAWLACALSLAGCNFGGGIDPIPGTLNFPIALALSPARPSAPPRWLYVVNSNFDLRFNEGTLMAFDLDEIAGTAAGERGLLDECEGRDPCAALENVAALTAGREVGIGSYADGLAVSPGGSRLYIASRSRQDLTFVSWTGDAFACVLDEESGDSTIPICAVQDTKQSKGDRDVQIQDDPVAVAAGRLADIGGSGIDPNFDFVLLAMRDPVLQEGSVALYIDREDADPAAVPQLVDVIGGFPDSPVTLTMQPGTGIGWLTSEATTDLGRVGVAVEPGQPFASFLYDAGSVRLGGLDFGNDSRDLVFDPLAAQSRAFVLLRSPESIGELDLTRMGPLAGDVAVRDLFEVAAGPSRLAIGRIRGRTYVLATAFDGRKLFVVDADLGALIAVVGGFSGPFELVIDEARELAYVIDFPVSVIRIVDLSPLGTAAPPTVVGTIGTPTPVEDFTN